MDISTQLQNRESEKGFTLVELAVVMIIIGLLIGGILKGQELITNARITTTASQIESMGAAYNGFIDQFSSQPGDLPNGATRLADCVAGTPCATGAAAAGGPGNGVIDVDVGVAPTLANEGTAFFTQLLAAGLITGLDGTNVLTFGTSNPTSPVGGGLQVGDLRAVGAPAGYTAAELRPRPYIVHNGIIGVVNAAAGALTPSQAANIDRRLDDGVPNTGTIISETATAACRAVVAGATVYDESAAASAQGCSIAYRL